MRGRAPAGCVKPRGGWSAAARRSLAAMFRVWGATEDEDGELRIALVVKARDQARVLGPASSYA
eukprot:4745044-Lingulodinium_polyedra.AAC.1